MKNCPNCGAPYDVELSTCPYCGTSYFDLSAIDIREGKPFYLKLKNGDWIFTSKVVVDSDMTVELIQERTSVEGRSGTKLMSVINNSYVNIDMRFKSVVDGGRLYTVETEAR